MGEYADKNVADKYAEVEFQWPSTIRQTILRYLRNLQKPLTTDDNENQVFELMLDAGCGNGKSTRIFTPYFRSIVGFDISKEQIEKAKEMRDPENIRYVVAGGENMPAADCTVDLVTSGFAVQDMDVEMFLRECKRVLKPSGAVALYGFGPTGLTLTGTSASEDKRGTDAFNQYYWSPLGQYLNAIGHPQRLAVDRYQSIYEGISDMEKTRDDSIEIVTSQSLQNLKNWLNSVPAFTKFHQASPSKNPLEIMAEAVKRAWDMPDASDENVTVDLTLSVYMLLLNKQTS